MLAFLLIIDKKLYNILILSLKKALLYFNRAMLFTIDLCKNYFSDKYEAIPS